MLYPWMFFWRVVGSFRSQVPNGNEAQRPENCSVIERRWNTAGTHQPPTHWSPTPPINKRSNQHLNISAMTMTQECQQLASRDDLLRCGMQLCGESAFRICRFHYWRAHFHEDLTQKTCNDSSTFFFIHVLGIIDNAQILINTCKSPEVTYAMPR